MFICIDPDNCCGVGKTLKTAHKSYTDFYDENYRLEELTFYEANEIVIEVQLVQKGIPIAKKI